MHPRSSSSHFRVRSPFRFLLAGLLLPLLLTPALRGEEARIEAILERARAAVGPEERIEAIETLQYRGTLEPAGAGESRRLILTLRKPAQQRLDLRGEDERILAVVNQLEGFTVEEDLRAGTARLGLMTPLQQARFRMNAVENLYFFRPPPRFPVERTYLGSVDLRGRTLEAIRLEHGGRVAIVRYFDPESGQLVATRLDDGTLNVETATREAGGLQLTAEVEAYEDGELLHTLRFEEIRVNPELPPDFFAMPGE